MSRPESCTDLAGGSPVRVIAGEPGSRPQPRGEIPEATAGCRKPSVRREQGSGPQLNVNAAASSDYQPKGVWEGRAAHVPAKATDSIRLVRSGCWTSPGYGRWHASTGGCGTGETLPGSLRRAKAARIRSETEVVWSWEGVRGVHSTGEGGYDKPPEGRGPASVEAGWRSKREGMPARDNNPVEEAREFADSLWRCAKQTVRLRGGGHLNNLSGDDRREERTCSSPLDVQATSGRPSVSRVLENCTHGLKGGCWRRAA
jgi:hypothetical protein